MADRLRVLRRIASVQAEMVKLAEWRLAAADRAIAELGADQGRLRAYVDGSGALGVSLAQAALGSIRSIDRRLAEAEADRAVQRDKFTILRQRDHAVGAMVDRAALQADRAAEAVDLRQTMEAWLARGDRTS